MCFSRHLTNVINHLSVEIRSVSSKFCISCLLSLEIASYAAIVLHPHVTPHCRTWSGWIKWFCPHMCLSFLDHDSHQFPKTNGRNIRRTGRNSGPIEKSQIDHRHTVSWRSLSSDVSQRYGSAVLGCFEGQVFHDEIDCDLPFQRLLFVILRRRHRHDHPCGAGGADRDPDRLNSAHHAEP